MTIEYKIEFFSYWHTGSGLSGSTYSDILVNKTQEGLPFIPGKTLKGLLREAAEIIHGLESNSVSATFIKDVFGEKPPEDSTEAAHPTSEASCFFSSANLSEFLRTNLDEEEKRLLYHVLASTKIDRNGLAENGSLRQMEVTVPLVLFARIEHFPDDPGYKQQLDYCFKWIKRMGLNRFRGLGRCQISFL
jgi:CRISPR/Cas system CSM-associated protein Csm3 (group 7 of RAMP superfamily)